MKIPFMNTDTGRAAATAKGNAGYDNPRENIDPHVKTQVIDTKEIVGKSGNISETLSGAQFRVTGDNSSADTAYVPMVLYNTDATPPTASGFPIGTIYIQYTA